MKAGWKTGALETISKVFTDGNWIETKDQSTDGIRLVQTGNVGEGVFKDRRDKARWIDEDTFARLNCFEVLPGDCLISRLPDPVGRACLIPNTGDKMITAVDCSIIRPDESKIDPAFLVYFTQSRDYLRDVDDRCSGTTRRRISRKNLGKVPIPLPPLDEQRRIVAVLDEAFEGLARARAHTEANLQNARELFETTLSTIFSKSPENWGRGPISASFQTATGSTPPKRDETLFGKEIPFVKPPELLGATITDTVDGLSAKGGKAARIAPAGSVLVSCIGILGKIGIAETDVAFNQQINAIFPDHSIALPEFIFFQALSEPFKQQLEALAGGTTVPIVNKSRFNSIQITLPPVKEQTRLVDNFQEIRRETQHLSELYKTKLKDLDDLRQSLLQKAFAGELT